MFCLAITSELSHAEGQNFMTNNVSISRVLSGPAAQVSHRAATRLSVADQLNSLDLIVHNFLFGYKTG